MYKDVMEALESAGFELVPREDVKLGDSIVGTQSDISEAMYAGEVVGGYSGYTRVLDKPGGASAYVGATHVWRKPAPRKPGTYAEVEYGGVTTTGLLLHGGKCAVTAMTRIVPMSDVKVVETIWEPGEGDADLVRASVAPSLGALKERPDWCVIDSGGDRWAWFDDGLMIRRDGETDFSTWWIDEETADRFISHKDSRWELMAKDERHERD